MQGLADMFEGWAQDDRTTSVNMARLTGWADGFEIWSRSSEPTTSRRRLRRPVSLIKFMARQMSL
jgi:hypothetical protein